MSILRRLGVPFVAALVAAAIATAVAPVRPPAVASGSPTADLKPLVNSHEFMEHVVAGTFELVKNGLRNKPPDARAWRSVRDASLLLGESGNLLLIRKPDDVDPSEWSRLSIGLREAGDALTRTAKAKDFEASRAAYSVLVRSCNECHTKYGDDGEPRIQP